MIGETLVDLGLAEKYAIITGASQGIGKSIALTLAKEGVNVAICARPEAPLRAPYWAQSPLAD